MLRKSSKSTTVRASARAKRHRLTYTSSWLALGLAASALTGGLAAPAEAIQVGDTVVNPVTGLAETVVEVDTDQVAMVVTDQGHAILLPDAVDDVFSLTDTSNTVSTYKITAVRPDEIDVEDTTTHATKTFDRVVGASNFSPGANGSGVTPFTVTASPGDVNFVDSNIGQSGGGGRNGGGVNIPFGALGTLKLSYSPTAGGAGASGVAINDVVTGAPLHTATDKIYGILVSSIGGDGGKGGDFIGVGAGSPGGAAGVGGTVTLDSQVDITTTGEEAIGIFAQSRAGKGGAGGAGYVFAGGGSGGSAAMAGIVTVTNHGTIATTGTGSVGIQAQSLGGGSGGGGDSYGVIVDAGGGSTGGDGSDVTVYNYGIVQTSGDYAHGILAQSIGGSGGNGGAAGGLVAFGDGGATGGDGGAATINAMAGSSVLTQGTHAYGLFAQSIGGGGGSGRAGGGIVTLGSDGGAGGNGGAAAVTVEGGASVATTGDDSHAVFAQSVGGGGGDAGDGGGIVTLGGKGSAGGNGGAASVTVEDDASITTTGQNSHGIFVQSIGGGGGSGGDGGGIVTLGGAGSGGGIGGLVTVSNAGSIETSGERSRGIFAQSIGGGGGAGGDSGGLVSIGGTAGPGSTGGDVSVTNSGLIVTHADRSNAIQAQSIGGGGGDGGTAGGELVTVGGSGSSGGAAGLVSVNNIGAITTFGDDSHGIFAQSVGGGGGNGGASKSVSAFAGVAVGGAGGDGGAGNTVSVTFDNRTRTGLIFTDGDRSRGLFAQSVGGGGGSGGMAASVSVGFLGAVSVAVGGSGGSGGQGGTVNIGDVGHCLVMSQACYDQVADDLNVQTRGDNSEGLYVQSVGGGGGAGGYSVAAAVSAGPAAVSVATGVGGSGGDGGAGGDVTVRTGGTIATGETGGAFVVRDGLVTSDVRNSGEFSTGLLAQSVGGGGGKGGYNISASLAASGGGSLAMSTGVGGSGGDGGIGGKVDVDFNGSISTLGDDAAGAIIQSVGGGGGAGGYNISASIASSGGVGLAASVGVGGSGGAGSAGGTALGTIGGDVSTTGARSTGVVVQSVGGGGGNGGFNVSGSLGFGGGGAVGLSVGVGGQGAGGGAGGDVWGTTLGKITTSGDDAGGLLVQSVGGGGGNGGFNVSGAITNGGVASAGISVGVGGNAGTGSWGGYTEGHANGLVATGGKNAAGVTVQSIGGGGGSGGFNVAGGIGGGGTAGGAISVGLGGSGGGGGNGGEVHGFASDIVTFGDDSNGFLAQSVGGGGGNGGFSIAGGIGSGGTAGGAISVSVGGSGGGGSNGGYVEGRTSGFVGTAGQRSTGVTVQSLGGGGGNGGFSVAGGIGLGGTGGGAISVGLGGSGGNAGDGDEVHASAAEIYTLGDYSGGFLAQSVGGGGGNGGFSVAGSIGLGGTGGGGISVGIGGSGAGGGQGKLVDAAVTGNVTTFGKQADGIVAQSLGGGGGNGGFTIAGGIGLGGTGAGAVSVGVGGSGGGGGDSGKVDLTVDGLTTTSGDDSTGIIAQSIAGGGGNGGFSIAGNIAAGGTGAGTMGISVGGSGGTGADVVDKVTLNVTGDITPTGDQVAVKTSGAGSRGILAQSVGGGGGNGGFSVVGGVAAARTGAGNLGVGVGGAGGAGGASRRVEANVTGDVITTGAHDAEAVLVQSIGGGGGNGGFSITGGIAASNQVAGNLLVGVGGMGGDGGGSGAVSGTVDGNILTLGDNSAGVTYQSLAGGGGNGGFNITGGVSLTSTASGGAGNLGVGVGGFGGNGSSAEQVDATILGNILTIGDKSYGALLQSVGGGGGNGGFNITGGIQVSAAKGGGLGVGIGGFGGDGGNGGVVEGTLDGNVTTFGDGAYGAMLQSVGGGGGNGGFNVTGAVNLTSSDGGFLGVGIGGFGGTGGFAKSVQGTITGDYHTEGRDAGGVIVQSLGGGGGNGGLNVTGQFSASKGKSGQLSVGVGGFGGDGGHAGTAWLERTGDTVTTGLDSQAILVQSVGGGGGNGAINVTGGFVASKADDATINIGLGGFGGDASYAGDVTATIHGNVSATGSGLVDGDALFNGAVVAQSVGGGGGNGGLNVSGGIALTKDTNTGRAAAIGIGGFAGGGGDAGTVDVTIDAPSTDRVSVVSKGFGRSAVVAQSVGGGGGTGGINISGGLASNGSLAFGIGGFGSDGGMGKAVTATVDADIKVDGDNARGIAAQSVGGGGGDGGINISGAVTLKSKDDTSFTFGLGGKGGAANISGAVTVEQNGKIVGTGKNVIGILAQSVAGGGGDGGLNISANITDASTNKTTKRAIVGVGGNAGAGADAGDVNVTSTGDIEINGPDPIAPDDLPDNKVTTVFNSGGILAQSIGGGGGNGGMNISLSAARNSGNTLQFGVGGDGGAGGVAGNVTVVRGYDTQGAESASEIATVGDYSAGIMAQSVGGGGGNGGLNFNFGYNNLPKAENDDSNNKEYKALFVTVGGDGAQAGNAKLVSVIHNGDIETDGVNSHGIVAQSIGGGGGNSAVNLGGAGLGDKTKTVSFNLGGINGAAGRGEKVEVWHVGQISTHGEASIGIEAQSIGGGGGSQASLGLAGPVLAIGAAVLDSSLVKLSLGRTGGTGGQGGDVLVTSDGDIFTDGNESIGVLAQSIGGGGGNSTSSTLGGKFKTKTATYKGNLTVGLEGGSAAKGGKVTVTESSVIQTIGDRAHAIFAQSIGGGGGLGGTVGSKLALQDGKDGDFTQAGINVGGAGGDGSFGDTVTVGNSGFLITSGDQSSGIWAQSIGGTGGAGGDYLQANIQKVKAEKTLRTFNVNVGGLGGTGSFGGAVDVKNTGGILTMGTQSLGIRAESIGGGGGDGGAVSSATFQTEGGDKQVVNVNVGGKGGIGGHGGVVDVVNEGVIVTSGMNAEGIRATSTGGGGGNGGVIINTLMTITGTDSQSQNVAMNFGGLGGHSGYGDVVTVKNTHTTGITGAIWTQGDGAHGIFAQSLGGGGGNGSSIINMNGLRSSKDSFAVGLNFGGWAGDGNVGRKVTVENTGVIETDGDGAYGILAQSLGGGGGNGGLVLAAAGALGKTADAPLLAIGGRGGNGEDGGDVEVTNKGSILTFGAKSHGIVAQSIGGGGGNAGIGIAVTNDLDSLVVSNTLSLIAGAVSSGGGGAGRTVTVNQDGDVTVLGDGAQAVVAESINGGGGHLDFDLRGIVGLPGFSFKNMFKDVLGIAPTDVVTDPKIATRLGGTGLTNMNANKVTVNSTGTYGVGGKNGVGSFMQSLGGGGGSLNLKTEQTSAAASLGPDVPPVAVAYSVDLGGENGVNNSGADLDGTRTGDILTTEDNSLGVLAQTIGGGGGHAIIDNTAEAGTPVGPIDLNFGGGNGSNETGGNILRTEDGLVETIGDMSTAVMVQSIGGGGGAASVTEHSDPSFSATGSAAAPDPDPGLIKPMFLAPPAPPVTVAFGAAGGSGLNGGNVTNTYLGGFDTSGDHALGLIVQSVGAGGGVVTLGGTGAASVALGGTLGASGNGGALTIINLGAAVTEGAGSHGVFLQSIGGGGGAVFGAGTGSSVTLNSANTGNGGAIQLTQTGAVMVTGAGADGVIAQSLGGGGGWVDGTFAGTAGGNGKGGTIRLDLNAGAVATGAGGTAVLAQSLGGLGGDTITVNARGTVRGNAAGVRLEGGTTNMITTSGSMSAVSGLAIAAGAGNETVLNDGMVIGNVDLGTGANSFSNRTGSAFIAFNTINLFDGAAPASPPPAGSTFTNAGDFQMGLAAPRVPIDLAAGVSFDNLDGTGSPESNLLYGARVINTVALDGNFVQTAGGHMAFDVAFGPYASDKVNVTGTAQVAGTGTVVLTWLSNTNPVTLFAAKGGGVDNGLKIDNTLAVDYRIVAGASGIQLALTTHFAQPFLNRNGLSLANHINSAISLGGSDGIGRAAALLGNLKAGEETTYSAVMDELSAEPFLVPLIVQNTAAERFGRDMSGCATPAVPGDRSCVWGHIDGNSLSRTPDGENNRASGQGQSLSTGFERPLNDRWSVTLAVGYDRINGLAADNGRARSDGQNLNLGLGLRRTLANGGDLALSLTSGWQTLDTKRAVDVFGPLIGTSHPQSMYLNAALKAGKTFQYKRLYARPMLNLSAIALRQYAFTEQGLEGIGIAGVARHQVIASAGPELALGYVSAPGADYRARLEIDAGRTYRDVSRIVMPYRLIGANPAADPALVGMPVGKSSNHVGVNFDVTKADSRMSMRFSYTADQSAKLHSNAVGMSLRMTF